MKFWPVNTGFFALFVELTLKVGLTVKCMFQWNEADDKMFRHNVPMFCACDLNH